MAGFTVKEALAQARIVYTNTSAVGIGHRHSSGEYPGVVERLVTSSGQGYIRLGEAGNSYN